MVKIILSRLETVDGKLENIGSAVSKLKSKFNTLETRRRS